jgi:hypothetical protein
MKPEEQAEFVNELCKTIAHKIIAEIDKGKIPEYWDGIELRQLIADEANYMTRYLNDNKKRLREYRNTVLVNDL